MAIPFSRAGNTLAAVGRLIICVLRNTSTDMLKVVLIEEMLSLDLLHDDCQVGIFFPSNAFSAIINLII